MAAIVPRTPDVTSHLGQIGLRTAKDFDLGFAHQKQLTLDGDLGTLRENIKQVIRIFFGDTNLSRS